jgi:hypothetical protein
VLVAVCVFGVGARDDPYITFWVAEQLAKTGRLVNINGVRIEQSSSLAHVVVLAALYFVTRAPLPVLGYLVGLAGLVATIVLSSRLARRINARSELVAALLVALAFPLVYWATGELETDLAAASVLWFVLSLHTRLTEGPHSLRSNAAFVASAVLIATVRPDTMIVALLVSGAALAASGLRVATPDRTRWIPAIQLRGAVIAFGSVVMVTLVLGLFRELVFHSWLPQPEIAKLGGISWFTRGFSYVFSSFPYWMWLTFLILFGLGVAWCLVRRSLVGCLGAATFAAGVFVIAFSRGDWMGGARLLVPYLAPGLVVMAAGATSLSTLWRRVAVIAVVAVECFTLVLFANGTTWLSSEFTQLVPSSASASAADFGSPFGGSWTSTGGHASQLPWYTSWDFISTRDSVFLASATPIVRRLITASDGKVVTIASNQAGLIFYTWANDFPGKIRFIDMQGIATDDFSRCTGLTQSFAGNLMTLTHWVSVAGKCAPALPDLYFTLGPVSASTLPARYYHVVSYVSILYDRGGLTTTIPLYETEYLAQRNGWSP